MSKYTANIFLTFGVTTALVAGASPASAAEQSTVDHLKNISPDVLADVAGDQSALHTDGGISSGVGDSAAPSPYASDVQLDITFNAEQERVSTYLDNGLTVSEYSDNTSVTAIEKTDGSTQFVSVLRREEADHSLEYDVTTSSPEQSLVKNENGSISIFEAEKFVGGIASPWALDAQGSEVDTHYELDGNTVTQIIVPDATDMYPIVADPWLGRDLLQNAWITSHSNGYVVNANPTGWGRNWNGIATHNAHVSELESKLGSSSWRVTSTIDNQFICHVMGNYFEQGTYNMESWRPDVYWANQLNPTDRCNPGGGGSS